MSEHRDNFVRTFSEEQAAAIEAAADEHKNGVHDETGSDPFRWALLIAIGYECMSKERHREYHGITAPWDELREWMLARTEWFKEHDGEADYISLMAGVYNEYVGAESVQS